MTHEKRAKQLLAAGKCLGQIEDYKLEVCAVGLIKDIQDREKQVDTAEQVALAQELTLHLNIMA